MATQIFGTFGNVNWIRHSVQTPHGRRLRVLIYARFSTDEQNPRSISDQVEYCKALLKDLKVEGAQIAVLNDPGHSGELSSRPGINKVREGIQRSEWDLIIVEDSSRLFRSEQFCFELVGSAVDHDIRVICINDRVDTADEEGWEENLHNAQHHHSRANKFTSCRIKRAFAVLWAMGAAIGLTKPGYRRKRSESTLGNGRARGPYFDEIDLDWAVVIYEVFVRIAAGVSPARVAAWLTQIGLPKTANSKNSTWTARNVIALIRRTDYRGVQQFRQTVAKKHHGTGKHVARRNARNEVWTRDVPHLRIVTDDLWFRANAALDARNRRKDKGKKGGCRNPQTGVPRDSRGPLSNLIYCAICGRKMRMEGRIDGGYRCAGAKSGDCWNKATALRELVHDRVGRAILDQLPAVRQQLSERLIVAEQAAADGGQRQARQAELKHQIEQTEQIVEALVSAIESTNGESKLLVEQLIMREGELERLKASSTALAREARLPNAKEIEDRFAEIEAGIAPMDRGARDILQQVITPIQAAPCQQFGGNKVVLRARFEIKVAAVLPPESRWSFDGLTMAPLDELFGAISVELDLFEMSTGPAHWAAAFALREQNMTLSQIGAKLGIGKRGANISLNYGLALRAAGLNDPFIKLLEPPANGSRWGSRNASTGGEA